MIDLPATIQQCSVGVHPETVTAIVRHESGGNPLALNIDGATVIPADYADAVRIQAAALAAGKSTDTGLMQINSRWLKKLAIAPSRLFEPCANVQIGTQILRQYYSLTWSQSGNIRDALIGALSMYNTGSATAGYGYVQKVVLQAGKALADPTEIGKRAAHPTPRMTPRTAPTGFPMQTAWNPPAGATNGGGSPSE
jgi:type IV secretion system protein VirB1